MPSTWTALSRALLLAAAGALASAFGAGCQVRCETGKDCITSAQGGVCRDGHCETQCYVDQDCLNPPECQGNPLACTSQKLRCTAVGQCVQPVRPRSATPLESGNHNEIPVTIDGWDEPPGTGNAFIIDSLAIADKDRGFDIDGRCRGPGDCVDNSLYQLGQLGNDQIRQGLLGGETLLLIELAGLDKPFIGNDATLTAKFYGARDADDPFFPANNFQIPAGETKCCEFKINPQSIAGIPPQSRARAPAKVERGQMKSLAPVPISFTLTVGVPPHPEIRVEKVYLSARVPANLGVLSDGLLGGAVPVNTLAQTENPYCKTLNNLCQRMLPNSTLIDLIASILQPDIDLDVPPDGLEALTGGANGRIAECRDGNGQKVDPIDSSQPWTCALQAEIADGYSVGITFSGVAATVVGVGQ
ncbi:MAG: hypothetical protein U1E65_12460 [Myxococcota bacterium]